MSIQHKEIAAIRQDYALSSLNESDVLLNPIEQFKKWFNEALHSEVVEVNAFVLSTVSKDLKPSSRIVLLKDIKPDGFSFFTNYDSRKGQEMAENPSVSALFFWPELQRQVRIEAQIEKLPTFDSDEYFASRPRGSRIGAIASPQSHDLSNRAELEALVQAVEAQFADSETIPRPANWGGYLLKPSRIEFWQGRSSRLHDRIVFSVQENGWTIKRIAP
ncbi:pyridoxamine 5'-phosphate oxidase [Sphingobacterium sp. DK4209]|uniref:Pyridoxine/pyridoxamine 5'-phosphate oxidase n=1 Tax=Sphingobacterium zhuxiongii TaxID=2662364 RepID=A0A5Q0Q953_9SPHI|nr:MULTISPECIES: pyridoxamine 5'-phosphate oxidase [unclassified Sphingobacterium]MVZ65115.1 pyridoxamine 5'-phosphate oxidase [Sphingobacterium sp. DK4209]QGA26063.1 pyridoxamine 5'-phosphate oxidase [Sphingobacterium sp. dk4302]